MIQYPSTSLHDLTHLVGSIKGHIKHACADALCAGQILTYLRDNVHPLTSLCRDVGISRVVAYRWINAYNIACERLGLTVPSDYASDAWQANEDALRTLAETTSLNRLLLGAAEPKGDMYRLECLTTGAETAEGPDEEAIYSQAVDKVDKGEWTLIQAMRAIGGQLNQDKAERRKAETQQLLGLDGTTGALTGQLPKTATILRQAFAEWDSFDATAREKFKGVWKVLVLCLPDELKQF